MPTTPTVVELFRKLREARLAEAEVFGEFAAALARQAAAGPSHHPTISARPRNRKRAICRCGSSLLRYAPEGRRGADSILRLRLRSASRMPSTRSGT